MGRVSELMGCLELAFAITTVAQTAVRVKNAKGRRHGLCLVKRVNGCNLSHDRPFEYRIFVRYDRPPGKNVTIEHSSDY